MRHLTATEEDGEFHLIAGIEELGGLTAFGRQVMVVDLRPDPDLFQLNDMLIFTRLTLFTTLLVSELSIVHQTADGRRRIRRHLNEVEPPVPRHLERFIGRDDPDLRSLFIDQADFADPNAFVYASLDGSRNSMLRFSLVGSFVFTQPECQAALARGLASLPTIKAPGIFRQRPRSAKHEKTPASDDRRFRPWLEGNGSMPAGHRSIPRCARSFSANWPNLRGNLVVVGGSWQLPPLVHATRSRAPAKERYAPVVMMVRNSCTTRHNSWYDVYSGIGASRITFGGRKSGTTPRAFRARAI